MSENHKKWTLQEAVNHLFDPKAAARLKEIGERLHVLRKPRTGDPWTYAWAEDPEEYRNQRIAKEIGRLEDEAGKIRRGQVDRLREELTKGRLAASGYPQGGHERAGIDADLWPLLTKIDFQASAAWNPKTGLRFDQIRVMPRPPTADSAPDRSPYSKMEQVVIQCIQSRWRGHIPLGLKAKERNAQIREEAKKLSLSVPSERTIRNALRKRNAG